MGLTMSNNMRRMPLPKQTRAAVLEPTTFNAELGTVELCFTTGASVRRFDLWQGVEYDEVLDVSPKSVRMDRLTSGAAPLLNSHESEDLDCVIGSITEAWIKDGNGYARARLSSIEEHAGIVANVQAGVIRNVSFGYIVHRFEVSKAKQGGIEIRKAVDWEPYEISLVPIGADPGASVREIPGITACELVEAEPLAIPPDLSVSLWRSRLR